MCPRVDVEALDKRATLHQLQARGLIVLGSA